MWITEPYYSLFRIKYPISVIEDLLEEVGSATRFSKIGLRSGYWQVRMAREDKPKTTFKSHKSHYEFMVIPFVLTYAPTTFQNLMNSIFRSFVRKFFLVFFNDILIYSGSQEENIPHLKIFSQLIRDNKLFAKKSMCNFGSCLYKPRDGLQNGIHFHVYCVSLDHFESQEILH